MVDDAESALTVLVADLVDRQDIKELECLPFVCSQDEAFPSRDLTNAHLRPP